MTFKRKLLSILATCLAMVRLCADPVISIDPTVQMRPKAPAVGLLQPPPEVLSAADSRPLNTPSKPQASPTYSSPSPKIAFSKHPTDEELIVSRALEVRLAPQQGRVVPGENESLAAAVLAFHDNPEDVAPLDNFLRAFPRSRWRASVLLNAGLACRNLSRWSNVIPYWEEAWTLSKDDHSELMRIVADRTVGELANIHSRLGHIERLKELLDEVKGRDVRGPGAFLLKGAREGLGLMVQFPEEGYRCGPLALARIYEITHPEKPIPIAIDSYKSTPAGTSLDQVHQWAKELNLDYQAAYRSPGAEVIVPSVVHWKVGHFAALTAGNSGRFTSQDATFGMANSVSVEVLDSEASGYFLVPSGNLPRGWRPISNEEARRIFGKGAAGHTGSPPGKHEIHIGGSGSSSSGTPKVPKTCGMTTYSFGASSASLALTDTPEGYAPPVGPEIRFTVNYNSQESSDQAAVTNVGMGWCLEWLSYLQIQQNPANGTLLCYGPGGGVRTFGGISQGQTSGTYAPDILSQDVLQQLNPSSFILTHPDGSKDIYNLSDGGSAPYVFRTQSVDRYGNTVNYSYDSYYRLVAVTDAIQQTTHLYYNLTSDSTSPDFYRVTTVTDPFQRSASFTYNNGALTSITDVLNIQSSFVYGPGNFVTSLTTPYGTTSFTEIGATTGIQSGVQAQDPLGGQERIEWDLSVNPPVADYGVNGAAPANLVPAGFFNGNLNFRNTFYWSKKAMLVAPLDYNKAFIYHWLHDASTGNSTTGFIIESTKAPLENRVWYAYPGQTISYYEGTSNEPSKVARILDDGTEQDYLTSYNSLGYPTQTTDPKGRVVNYSYYPDQNDVQTITVQNGNNQDLIATYTYNGHHLPLTVLDASQQQTAYTYNSYGELLTATDAKQETTTLAYDANGYLQTVTGPMTGATTQLTYDSSGRVHTVTDSEQYTVTMAYDAADRPTTLTYPDGTYTQTIYNRLDPQWTRDRLGRWTLTEYDALQHLVAIEDPLLRRTLFQHCTCGALIGITDPNGNQTLFDRDLQQRVTKKTFADGTSLSLNYESTTSRLKSITDANAQTKTYSYNVDDSLSSVAYSNSIVATPNVTYTYDPAYSRLTSMSDGVGTTVYSYNPITGTQTLGAGQLESVSGPLSSSVVTYSYDELGRVLTKAINGSANSSSVVYDSLGRVTSVTNPLGQFGYQYVDQTARVRSLAYPNGQVTNFAYYPNAAQDGTGNDDQRLQTIQNLKSGGSNLSTFAYTYDSNGEITSWGKQWDSGSNLPSTFTYDSAEQLLSAIVPNPSNQTPQSLFYTYDPAGNRTQEQIDATINTSSYNDVNEYTSEAAGGAMTFAGSVSEPAAITVGGNTATVDSFNNWQGTATVALGNNLIPLVATDSQGNTANKTINVTVSGGPSRTLTYDNNGNLTSNGSGQTYQWDAENRLVSVVQASGTTGFVYDGAGHRVQEKLNGTLIKQWVWCGSQPCEERDASGNVTKRFYAQGEQIGGAPYYFTRDHLGSVREMTDASGAIRARYEYDPFGRATKLSGDLAADFGFTGDYLHVATGLSLTLYRAYDPGLGRWLNRDPFGTNGGINLYGYVGNNPIDFVDPLGLWQVTIGVGWGIAGEISFGYNSGRANISGTIGVGGGIAGSFNPNDSGPSNMQGPSTTEGLVAKGDLDLGFVSLNGEAGVTTESDGCHHFHDKAYLVGGANLNAVEPGYPPFGGWSGEIGVQQSGTDNGGIQSRGTYAQSNGVNYSAGVLALAGAKVGVSW